MITNPVIAVTTTRNNKIQNDIEDELIELGQELKHQVLHKNKGFSEFHDSPIHKLRKELHERDVLYRKATKELKSTIADLQESIVGLSIMIEAEGMLLRADEDLIVEENAKLAEYKAQHESVIRLLGAAGMLILRRLWKLPGRVVKLPGRVFKLLHLTKKAS